MKFQVTYALNENFNRQAYYICQDDQELIENVERGYFKCFDENEYTLIVPYHSVRFMREVP